MDFPAAIPAWLAALLGAWLVLGVCVYGWLLRSAATGGDRVNAREFGIPDAFFASVFVLWFGAVIAGHFASPAAEKPVTQAGLIQGGVLFAATVGAIVGFLRMRGIAPARVFGLRRVHFFKALALAFALLLAAYPLILCAGGLMQRALGPQAEPQEVVKFIADSSKHARHTAIIVAAFLAILCAPVAEELIFRGYLYGVMKRYLGMGAGAIFSAAIFAAMHLNLASLPALFVLALCLTLAYEATGSLLVNMSMHALFNLASVLALLHTGTP